jgi:RNA polymerase sigma factor (sigma-70 family)
MAAPAEDDALIADIQAGIEGAAVEFCDRFKPRLGALARHKGLAAADLKDVVHETLAVAVTQLQKGKFEGRGSLAAWVYGIFDKRVKDLHRRRARASARTVSLETLTSEDTFSRPTSVLGLVANQETQLRVREALEALPIRERVVLLMNVQDGFSAREISQVLRLNKKTTEGILTAAKKHFKELVLEGQESASPRRLKSKGQL